MSVVFDILGRVVQFVVRLFSSLREWVVSRLRQRGKSNIDTRKLINAVCLSAEESRTLWPDTINYPNSYCVTTSARTYDLLVGQEDVAKREIEATLKKRVVRKGGTIGRIHLTFLPDMSLSDDDFVVACSYVDDKQLAGGAVVVGGAPAAAGRPKANVPAATVRLKNDTVLYAARGDGRESEQKDAIPNSAPTANAGAAGQKAVVRGKNGTLLMRGGGRQQG